MRTDELIDSLVVDMGPTPRGEPERKLALVAAGGALIALALVLAWLKLRPDLGEAVGRPFIWIKAGYTALLAVGAFLACERLARPGVSSARAWAAFGAVVAVFAGLALFELIGLDPAGRIAALRGGSWQVCSRNIALLGAPTTLIALAVLRGFAPTRPGLAGFACGAFSGAVAATVYGLHCPEATFAFVAVWYTLGVLGCAALGAVLGRWMLRWRDLAPSALGSDPG